METNISKKAHLSDNLSWYDIRKVICCLLCHSFAKELLISQEILFLFSGPCTLGEVKTLSPTRNPLLKEFPLYLNVIKCLSIKYNK